MYVLVRLKDKITISPTNFNLPIVDAIKEEINKKLSNRILINVGLCICLYDIIEICESFIFKGDGTTHTEVTFRFVVFRPFIGEVITGKLRSSSPDGIHVSLGFFDDIFLPAEYLKEPSRFDEKEQLWVWEYETEEGKHNLFLEKEELIKFKVKEEVFTDTSPPPVLNTSNNEVEFKQEVKSKKVPYLIKGHIDEAGLGLVNWWM